MVRWRTIASGTSSTETRQKLVLASERTELENYWMPVLKQNRAQPLIDFNKDRVAIIFLGTRNTGGYSAQVSDVIGQGGATAIVCVNELIPGKKQPVTQSLTSPWVMIAIDRGYLDLSAKFQKVESTALPSYQINPLTTFTPLPWSPCGYGIGGSWNDPCGFGFDTPYEFQNWCQRNRFDYPSYDAIDFSINRLVLVSAGDYGLGFRLQIGDVFISGGETIIQVHRSSTAIASGQRSYALLALSRQTQKYTVEYVVDGSECYLDSGTFLPFPSAGAWICSNSRDLERLAPGNVVLPNSFGGFDFTRGSLGIVFLGQQQPHVNYSVAGVAYRGTVAYVYVKKTVIVAGLANPTSPYFAFRFDKRIRSVKVVDAP
ncbi:MAG: protease complex subunit PrcB family protein [Armatimonadetes bacterium]|nr:protease complex subunit PrcB family protein [Armatimonadota bacterium]